MLTLVLMPKGMFQCEWVHIPVEYRLKCEKVNVK